MEAPASMMPAPSEGHGQVSLSFGWQIIQGASREPKFKATTIPPAAGMWLGVSFHPPGGSAEAPSQLAFPLSGGTELHEIPIGTAYRDGTFEAAIWSARTEAANCPVEDEGCRKQGFRLSGMRSYAWEI